MNVLADLVVKIVSVTGKQVDCQWQFISLYVAGDFVPRLKCICSSLSLCLAHTCALPVAAYSGVQLANATPAQSAAVAHDKSLFIISIVIEQFPLVVPWIFPSARKLLPKWQS